MRYERSTPTERTDTTSDDHYLLFAGSTQHLLRFLVTLPGGAHGEHVTDHRMIIAAVKTFDRTFVEFMNRWGVTMLRASVGFVFLWFGALKFFPGMSSAEGLAVATITELTFGYLPNRTILLGLATLETLIGIGLITGVALRAVLFLLWLQMLGTFTPLFLFPSETFVAVPFVPTLEGQYIIKNVIIVAAGLVVGAGVGQRSRSVIASSGATEARYRGV